MTDFADFTDGEKSLILQALEMLFKNGIRGISDDPIGSVEATVTLARSIQAKLMPADDEATKKPPG